MAYLLAALTLNPRTHFEGRNPPIAESVQDNTLSQYNLNDKTPVLERYSTWLSGLAQGDLGKTWAGSPLYAAASRRMWVSGQLRLIATIHRGLLAIAAGADAALTQYRLPDNM